MMFWFQLVVVVLLLIAVGWIAVGGGGHMSPPTPDRPDPAVPETGLLGRGDVDKVRFSVGARGYRMDEVDDVLDRLAYEIDVRERRIAELEGHAPAEDGVAESAHAPAAEQAEEQIPASGSAPAADSERLAEPE
ncbi:MAG TPA: DivIVA domain-containing protein [Actinospica sp.]|jgi:DivIVA domain-containing protein|nr:DivIVA domain-containing protein [Actinospica sp.]